MTRYCLEVSSDADIVHTLDCSAYDLGTLLGLGCLADLGEFHDVPGALAAITREHPGAQLCPECCGQFLLLPPQLRRIVNLPAITVPST